MKSRRARGAFWGWIRGCLFGSAFFFIPGLGPLAGWLVVVLESAAVVGDLGIPKDRILQDETALKADQFVLIIHGSATDATHAQPVPAGTNPEYLQHHPQYHSQAQGGRGHRRVAQLSRGKMHPQARRPAGTAPSLPGTGLGSPSGAP
jgi:hypothetical protein